MMKRVQTIISGLAIVILIISCDPLKKLKFVPTPSGTLPEEMTLRYYFSNKDGITGGTWINTPQAIPGRKLYIYYLEDTVIMYPTVRTYPRNVRTKITTDATPKVRFQGKTIIKNKNDFGLFFAAFNLQNTTINEKSAELVIVDAYAAFVEEATVQDSLEKLLKPDTTEYLLDENGKAMTPDVILYVRGANITTASMNLGSKIDVASQVKSAVFFIDNNYFSSGNSYSFDYKVGLTCQILKRKAKSISKTDATDKNKNKENNKEVIEEIKEKKAGKASQQFQRMRQQIQQQIQQQQQQTVD
ncbi:MAG: hypothetical protein V4635_08570 [Bacteroidota bacterium]